MDRRRINFTISVIVMGSHSRCRCDRAQCAEATYRAVRCPYRAYPHLQPPSPPC